jgi:hypothetical protein
MKNILITLAAVVFAAAPAASSFADDGSIQTTDTSNGYGYWFPTDNLNAPDGTGGVPLIKVRPPGTRATLIRPRVQFVAELLKSVENL